jgi:hypothetical protein
VKELNEMTIGRTDDPTNPSGATAFEAAKLFGLGRGSHLGQRSCCRVNQAEHMIAIDLPVKILIFPLASEGPSTHAPEPLATSYSLCDPDFGEVLRLPNNPPTSSSQAGGFRTPVVTQKRQILNHAGSRHRQTQ